MLTLRTALKILNLNYNTTLAEVKTQYRKMVKQYHPDATKSQDSKRFIEITEAYHYIVEHFDKIKTHKNSSKAYKLNKKIFEEYLKKSAKKKEHTFTFFLTPEEMLKGCKKILNFNHKSIQVSIPAMSYDGKKLVYLLDNERIIVKILLKNTYEFKKDIRGNIIIEATITTNTAVFGGKIEVKSPTGEKFRVKIPKGIKQGTFLRLKNKGLPLPKGKRGDLLITISIKKVIFDINAILDTNL